MRFSATVDYPAPGTMPAELERQLDIRLERIDEPNGDGIGSHFRYRITCRADVMRVIQLVNRNAGCRWLYRPIAA